MPSGLILSEGKTSTYTSSRERLGNVMDCKRRRGPNESRDKDSPSVMCQRPFWRADERVEVRDSSCSSDGKLSLKEDKPQFASSMKIWEGNRDTTLLFSLKGLEILHIKKEGTN